MNEAKTAKIRDALKQLDTANDSHWTEDGLPREGVVKKLANDQSVNRRDIQEAFPGFERTGVKEVGAVSSAADPLTGEPVLESNTDPTKNTGPLMTNEEVRAELEFRVKAANQELTDAQQAVRDAHIRVQTAQTALADRNADLVRQFPPLTVAQNIKDYIASEMAQREAAAQGYRHSNIAPGSQIDTVMQRSNSRGWRRPVHRLPVQTGAARTGS